MRLLALRGENLASLAEPFSLDFEAAPLRGAGIIAITGPTGAGKSTLLDALCLALFDRVPRLQGADPNAFVGRDGAGDAVRQSDARALLHHGAAAAFAEVDFEGRDGRRYRACWALRRARGRPDGKLKDASLRLLDLADGGQLSDKKEDCKKLIVAAIGLDFDQFRRAVLLAQGEFDSFLRAPAADRAKLLEQITGATIYGELSKAAHERARAEEAALAALRMQAGEHKPLDPDARAALDEQQHALGARLARLDAERRALEQRRAWREGLAEHDRGLRQAREDCDGAARLIAANAGERERLALLRRAALLRPLFGEAERRETAYRQAVQYRERIDNAAEEARRERERAAASLRAARDGEAARARDAFAELHACRVAAEATLAAAEIWRTANERAETLARRLDEWLASLDDHARARAKARGLLASLGIAAEACEPAHACAETRLAALTSRIDGIDRAALERRADVLRAAHESFRAAQAAGIAAAAAIEAARDAASRAEAGERRAAGAEADRERVLARLAGARTRLDEAERIFAWAEAAASDAASALRASLADGEPCPVCGAREHGSLDPDDALRARREQDRRSLAALREAIEADVNQCGALEATMREAGTAAQGARTEAERLDGRGREETARARQAAALAASRLADLGLSASLDRANIDVAWIESELSRVRDRLDERAHAMEEANALASRLARLREAGEALRLEESLARSIDAMLGADRADWRHVPDIAAWCRERAEAWVQHETRAQESRQRLAALAAPLAIAATRLADEAAFEPGPVTPSDAEIVCIVARQEDAFRAASALVEAAVKADRQAELQAVAQAGRTTDARRGESEALAARNAARDALEDACREAGLDREAVAQATQEAIDAIERAQMLLRGALQTAEAVRDERGQRRAAHLRAAPAEADMDPSPRLVLLPDEVAVLREEQAALAGRLMSDAASRERLAAVAVAVASREAGALVWRQLDELIGSADGAKFRRFAQSLTLDQLIGLANLQLRDLAPRYELQRAPVGELALQVVDRDMGDEVRGLANLSGGERFLLSLALSLGLAELSSGRGVRVQSLFIDEGFGALDRDSLAQAIGVLEQLQATGRQVAVISHIEEVKERILVKIAVTPAGGGRSRVAVLTE